MKKNLRTLQLLEDENEALRKEVETLRKKISISNSAFLNIVGKSLDGIVIVDQQKMVVYTNYAAMELFDCNLADLLGEPLSLECDTDHLFKSCEIVTELEIPRSDGSIAISEVSVLPAEWNNEPCFVVSFRDITERKKSEEILDYMSKHDYLTDLPNRVYFEERLRLSMEEAKARKQYMALMHLDLDNFKIINDSLGHNVGDLLLKAVSDILQDSIRDTDTVARLGGDEFALILSSLRKPDYPGVIARNILDRLAEPFDIDHKEVYAHASIGIAMFPLAATEPVDLVKKADAAMYNAKQRGKNQYRFFTEELNDLGEKKIQIINGLRKMIQSDELFLVYQPIIDIKKSTCSGIEALLRWQHPQLGLVSPDDFLPFAEEAGMMSSISDWVINQALQDYKRMDLKSLSFVSINMSANELDGSKTAETILSTIDQIGIEAHHLVLELTETSIMRHPENAVKKFHKLADIGVQIAVDDFGTGYSSLSYLKRLPLFILKIDKSFIDDIGLDANDEVIVKSTIQLAHSLGLKVIAEGVETKEQLEFLQAHDCDYVQGYYYSKPLLFEDFEGYMREK